MENPKLKDYYSQTFINTVADAVKKNHRSFDKDHFITLVFDQNWGSKELKDRMKHISHCLKETLPSDYSKTITILKNTAPLLYKSSKHSEFLTMFFPDFVETYGQDYWDESIDALELLTQYSSAEFAIRPFIKKKPIEAMKQMKRWASHTNHHVRRLASEGCRPRLPWAMALPDFKKAPSPILPILDILKDDISDYVRRSVANNLNDISKDNPNIVIKIATEWKGKNDNRDKLIKHACRTLLKSANKDTLTLFGFTDCSSVSLTDLSLDNTSIHIGNSGTFSFTLHNKKEGLLRLEYAIDYMKANGKSSQKVFQLREGKVPKGEHLIQKKHSFRQMSTRKHYPGEHTLHIIVNGERKESLRFSLSNP